MFIASPLLRRLCRHGRHYYFGMAIPVISLFRGARSLKRRRRAVKEEEEGEEGEEGEVEEEEEEEEEEEVAADSKAIHNAIICVT